MSVYQKLKLIQEELHVPKSQFNKFGNFHYRSAEDILSAAKPVCHKHNCVLTLSDNLRQVGDRNYVEANAQLVSLDSEDEKGLGVTAYAREEENKKGMDGAQITGGASSYARKYALNGLFCLDDVKDPDAQNGKSTEEEMSKVAEDIFTPITVEQKDRIRGKLKDLKITKKPFEDRIFQLYHTKNIDDLTFKQGAELEASLNEALEKMEATV